MPGLFDRFKRERSRTQTQPSLTERLRSYPPDELPHPGAGASLSQAQAEANLAHFLAAWPARLDALSALLEAETGSAIRPLVDADPPQWQALSQRLFEWSQARWASLAAAPGHRLRPVAAGGPRSGADIVYTLVSDVAHALGECVVRGTPRWRWVVDMDARSRARELGSVGRVVLRAEPAGSATEPFIVDAEAEVLAQLLEPDNPARRVVNRWEAMVRDAVEERHQAWFRQQQTFPPSN